MTTAQIYAMAALVVGASALPACIYVEDDPEDAQHSVMRFEQGITRIEAQDNLRVRIFVDPGAEDVRVEGRSDVLDDIETDLDDGELKIEGNFWSGDSVVTVTLNAVSVVEAEDGAQVRVYGLDEGHLTVKVEDGASLELRGGRLQRLDVETQDGSRFMGGSATVERAYIKAQDGSVVEICADDVTKESKDGAVVRLGCEG